MADDIRVVITNPALLQATCQKAVKRVAVEVLRDARLLAPRSPRQPPPKNPGATVTGNLKNSIAVEERGMVGGMAEATVGTTVHYGVYQEFGTRSIPARPFLGPALEAARRKYG